MKTLNEILEALPSLSGVMAAAAWRSVALLALVWLALWCWRRSPAAGRHLVWTLTFVCLLSLPALVPCLPKWQSPLVISPDTWNNKVPDRLKFMLGDFAPTPAVLAPGEAATRTTTTTPAHINTAVTFASSWQNGLTLIWLGGMLLLVARMIFTQWQLARLAQSLPECDQAELREILRDLQVQYGIRRPIRLLIFTAASPMTWGYWRPVIALPVEALDWPEERLRVVLRHELAHIRRRDWLTQELARLACACYWFNPLVWLAARQMRAEREQACDDYVLNAGTRPTEYATHLVEIARQFAGPAQLTGAVAMARPSGLEQRVHAILDELKQRRALGRKTLLAITGTVLSLGLLIAGCSNKNHKTETWTLASSKITPQYKSFVAEKTAQAVAATDATETEGGKMPPEFKAYFAAAAKGDWPTVKKMFDDFEKHAPQYTHPGQKDDPRLHGTAWEAVKETWGVLYALAESGEKYSTKFAQGIIDSIPPGSIYFGGTDPGRFMVTGMEKSQVQGDPFFLITQNALADGTYMDYVRHMYGEKIHLPTQADTQKCFADYTADAKHRLDTHQLQPGEEVTLVVGQVQVKGQVAVMAINGLIAKLIFDRNPDREFYIEESFPLDWMYPYLEPHGLILKVNRQPLGQMPETVVQTDQDYWAKEIQPMLGGWLHEDTSVPDVVAFAKKTYLQHDYSGFTGDRAFLDSTDAQKMFSKLRASIAGVYVWRAEHTQDAAERDRMNRAADFAFREAYALCPYSPETLFRYATLLVKQNRKADALALAETAAALDPKSTQIPGLIAQLKRP